MKVLYCSRDYTSHDLRFVRALCSAGAEVAYVRLEDDGVGYVRHSLPEGARWVEWAGGRSPRPLPEAVADLTPEFRRVLRDERPDVVHAGPVQSFGVMAARTDAAPTVLVSWGSDMLVDAHRDAWFANATEEAVRHCHGYVCDSRAVLDAAQRLRHGALPPHVCIPWGPDRLPSAADAAARSGQRDSLGWADAIVVISARAWHRQYRIPALVEVFAAAAQRDPRLRLLLLNDGEDAAAVDATIRRLGVDDRVHRPGVVDTDALQQWLAASDIYLSLVPSDGTSISLLEAMAHGLPVVVPRNAGNTEWVVDGESGFLVDPDDPDGFARQLTAIVQNPAHATRVGAAARRIVEERADWGKNSARLVALYESVVRS